MLNYEEKYKTAIASYLEAEKEDIFLYWKGRVALYALLKAINVKEEDEVILPAFTCVVVPNAIKYCGAIPVYIDINSTTYNVDIDKIEAKITPRTKVILCQNTFGLSSNVEELVTLAKKYNLYTIEDCTHGFGGTYNGKPNGTFCDAAFFSTQWNKPFSTGIGGFAYVKDEKLKNRLLRVNAELHKANTRDNFSLSLLYFIREHILTDSLYWQMLKIYRWLSKYNLVLGSSSGKELVSAQMPPNYFKEISKFQIKKGYLAMSNFSKSLQIRKENAHIYTSYLKKNGKIYVNEAFFDNHAFLKYPLLVKDKTEVMSLAEKMKIPLGEWFCSPLHPVKENLERWDMNTELFPQACQVASQIVNLPTDIQYIDKILVFLETIEPLII
jgi:perosamine synthetase